MHEASLAALAADLLESERRLVAVTSAWRRSTDAWARLRAHPAVVAVGGSLVDDVIAALDQLHGDGDRLAAAWDAGARYVANETTPVERVYIEDTLLNINPHRTQPPRNWQDLPFEKKGT